MKEEKRLLMDKEILRLQCKKKVETGNGRGTMPFLRGRLARREPPLEEGEH